MSRASIRTTFTLLRQEISQTPKGPTDHTGSTFPYLTRLSKEPASRLITQMTSNHCRTNILPKRRCGRGALKLFSLRESYIAPVCHLLDRPSAHTEAVRFASVSAVESEFNGTGQQALFVSTNRYPNIRPTVFFHEGERELQGKFPTPAKRDSRAGLPSSPFQVLHLHFHILSGRSSCVCEFRNRSQPVVRNSLGGYTRMIRAQVPSSQAVSRLAASTMSGEKDDWYLEAKLTPDWIQFIPVTPTDDLARAAVPGVPTCQGQEKRGFGLGRR